MRGESNWEKTQHVGAHRGHVTEAVESLEEVIDGAA
jgi:hypothetical protein